MLAAQSIWSVLKRSRLANCNALANASNGRGKPDPPLQVNVPHVCERQSRGGAGCAHAPLRASLLASQSACVVALLTSELVDGRQLDEDLICDKHATSFDFELEVTLLGGIIPSNQPLAVEIQQYSTGKENEPKCGHYDDRGGREDALGEFICEGFVSD